MGSDARVSLGPDVFRASVRDTAAHHRRPAACRRDREAAIAGLFKCQAGFPTPVSTESSQAASDTSSLDSLSLGPERAVLPGLAFPSTPWGRMHGRKF